jgi:hypothetical protein
MTEKLVRDSEYLRFYQSGHLLANKRICKCHGIGRLRVGCFSAMRRGGGLRCVNNYKSFHDPVLRSWRYCTLAHLNSTRFIATFISSPVLLNQPQCFWKMHLSLSFFVPLWLPARKSSPLSILATSAAKEAPAWSRWSELFCRVRPDRIKTSHWSAWENRTCSSSAIEKLGFTTCSWDPSGFTTIAYTAPACGCSIAVAALG